MSSSVGERLGGGRGAGVTSVVNGLGGVGAILEGPVVGFISHEVEKKGVFSCPIFLKCALYA